jgi:hypothetical protein
MGRRGGRGRERKKMKFTYSLWEEVASYPLSLIQFSCNSYLKIIREEWEKRGERRNRN